MASPASIISTAASLQNDTAQQKYTNTACLPYLNLALDELQEFFEQNNISNATNKTSSALTIPSSSSLNTYVGFATSPTLPTDLIEIQQLWESPSGLNEWTPMTKVEFLPHYLEDGQQISQFLLWSWVSPGQIALISANQDNDIKMDYVAYMFQTPILIGAINTDLGFINIKTYLEFQTAGHMSMYIGENPTRATTLYTQAVSALDRSLGIFTKGKQSISFRRRPFRASYKRRGITY